MSEQRELDQLQRRLDHAFGASRPRRGFEDELWLRVAAGRRRWWQAPGLIPVAGLLTAFLIVVASLGALLNLGGLHRGGAPSAGSVGPVSAPAASARSGAANVQAAPAGASFGRLPRPALKPAGYKLNVRPEVPLASSFAVWRYTEPASLPTGAMGTDAEGGFEPRIVASAGSSGGAPAADVARQAADAYVAARHLQPPQPNRVDVSGSTVTYVRLVAGADEVALDGTPEGLAIEVDGSGTVYGTSVPLNLPFTTASYPGASIQQVRDELSALSSKAAGAPTILLTSVKIVYVVAFDGTYGYLEPAFMFRDATGQARVIVPAVAASQLR